MRTVIEDAVVVTMDAADRVLPRGSIVIEDGRIVSVTSEPVPASAPERRVAAEGAVVMPGIVNAHTHLFQTLLRGVYEGIPFPDWLRSIYRCGLVLTIEDCVTAARLGCLEALRSGVTTVVEHHFLNLVAELPDATIAGMRDIGVRSVFARTIMDESELAPAEMLESPEQGLRSVEALIDRHRGELGDGLLTMMTGPNTPGASSSGRLARATAEFAARQGLGQSMHLSESASVLRAVRDRYGHAGIISWLESLDALSGRILGAHCVHVSAEEIAIMARRGISVSHNAVSNMFLGDGIAPVTEYLAAGVNVALGTDGAASNNSQDMFEVMKFAALLQRARLQDSAAITPIQALRMATINGARAIGLGDLVGSLEPGKRADLIVLDLRAAAHNVAVHDVVSHLVHCARGTDVELVMVDGRILMEGGEVVGLDEPRLLAEAQAQGEDLVRRLVAA